MQRMMKVHLEAVKSEFSYISLRMKEKNLQGAMCVGGSSSGDKFIQLRRPDENRI